MRLQQLDESSRELALREMACDRIRASEVYPLCRMLFEAKEKQDFRRPKLGYPRCVGSVIYSEWPLEPIVIYRGVPILITKGYTLGGVWESPEYYVMYCLYNCRWREEKYTLLGREKLQEIVSQFIEENPKLAVDEDWIWRQVD